LNALPPSHTEPCTRVAPNLRRPLRRMRALSQLATAAEESAKDAVSLASQLGGLLLAKMEEGMKTKELAKELFDKMDKNGDGSISKM
jgi:hypothetical protein